ncbi:MAG: chemotaxis-specific protein-glutamate methyltransferase CheB [Myxococcales bacterium]|jgi:two-component system chemotaxis response regulator CheB
MIRCLIVDDSPTFRGVLRGILATAPGVSVVGEAGDGEEAIARTLELSPDVITMDVRMPRRNGLDAIREIMRVKPTPIIVVSAAARDANEGVSFQALRLGAIEVLEKPHALDAARFASQSESIRQAVRAVAGLKLVTRHCRTKAPALATRQAVRGRQPPAVIGICASTGGPPALHKILSSLPREFPIPLLVVQHIAAGFSEGLVRWLGDQCSLEVRLAERGEEPQAGTVLFAPDGHHMLLSMGRIRLDDGPPIKGLRPSGTVLFASLARELGARAAGFVLTGMGDDGAAGLKLMRERGAFTASQSQASSVVYGMPRVAFESGAAEVQLELEDIPGALMRLAGMEMSGVGASPVRRKRLLLADDTETILQVESMLLSDSYELMLARNGMEALVAARAHLPDGILLDHSMPHMTGAQVLQALRADSRTRSIPVIMVSSETDDAIVKSWWASGCQAVVPKPIDERLLVGTVRKHIS